MMDADTHIIHILIIHGSLEDCRPRNIPPHGKQELSNLISTIHDSVKAQVKFLQN